MTLAREFFSNHQFDPLPIFRCGKPRIRVKTGIPVKNRKLSPLSFMYFSGVFDNDNKIIPTNWWRLIHL